MHHYSEAEPLLKEAFAAATEDADKARFANDLGNLYVGQRDLEQAEGWYAQARKLAPNDDSLQVAARLNLARVASAGDKPSHWRRCSANCQRWLTRPSAGAMP